MYIVFIGWLYVTLLMALTETNLVAGILTFGFYGLVPVSLLWYLFGRGKRRPRPLERSLNSVVVPPVSVLVPEGTLSQGDGSDPQTDQQNLQDGRP